MARKRTELGHELEAEIRARTERGESAETIAAALKTGVSVATIRRRQAEARGKPHGSSHVAPPAHAARPSAAPAATPAAPEPDPAADVPDAPPVTSTLDDLDRWIKRLETAQAKAEAAGNLTALASLAQKFGTLAALKHRITPLPKPDPNESPDMKALAATVATRFEKLLNDILPAAGA